MKKLLSQIIEICAKTIPLWLYPKLVRRSSIDVFYHAVSDDQMTHVCHLYSVVPETDFIAALGYLKAHYQFVSYQLLHAHRIHGAPLPKNAVHLSFDDGFSECFSVVRPLLLKHQIPCTFFVTTDWLDNQAMFYRNKISLCIEELRISPEKRLLLEDLAPNVSFLGIVIKWLKELRISDEMLI
ncbi:MAG: polysaccharide deacetylase family protein, partial [Chloroflexi bacterium]|nr:polysaccharide deacetylase family protein [Chloroflexota bacterium]